MSRLIFYPLSSFRPTIEIFFDTRQEVLNDLQRKVDRKLEATRSVVLMYHTGDQHWHALESLSQIPGATLGYRVREGGTGAPLSAFFWGLLHSRFVQVITVALAVLAVITNAVRVQRVLPGTDTAGQVIVTTVITEQPGWAYTANSVAQGVTLLVVLYNMYNNQH